MTTNIYAIVNEIKDYVRGNWGSPFVAAFFLLLLLATVCLSADTYALADTAATYAYFALTIGVFLQLVCFLKDRKKVTAVEAL